MSSKKQLFLHILLLTIPSLMRASAASGANANACATAANSGGNSAASSNAHANVNASATAATPSNNQSCTIFFHQRRVSAPDTSGAERRNFITGHDEKFRFNSLQSRTK